MSPLQSLDNVDIRIKKLRNKTKYGSKLGDFVLKCDHIITGIF